MKIKSLALGAFALALIGTTAFAEDASLVQPSFRCTACGAQYQVKTKVTKDNSIQMKFERVAIPTNPKNR